MKHYQPDLGHFFAASADTWMTTNPARDLIQLIKAMEKHKLMFNLFFVPVPYDTDYEIEAYRPVVNGITWLGMFNPKEK